MQTPETTIVFIIAAACTLTACYALACFTANNIAKAALDKTSSSERAKILSGLGTVLRHLFVFPWRRK